MKKFLLICFMAFTAAFTNAQSVSINTDGTTAAPSAMLDVKSTNKGLLIPRMTTAQRTAIASPANGLMVYDTDTKTFWYHNGAVWSNLSATANLTLPFEQTVAVNDNYLIKLTNTGNGAGIIATTNDAVALIGKSFNSYGVMGIIDNPLNEKFALYGYTNGTSNALFAYATKGDGTYTKSDGVGKSGLRGEAFGQQGVGVTGQTAVANGVGVNGISPYIGVQGTSSDGIGVNAYSNTGAALQAGTLSGKALVTSGATELNGNLKIAGGNTSPSAGAVLTSDASGNATWQSPIAFRVFDVNEPSSFLNINEWKKVVFKNEYYDYGNVCKAYDIAGTPPADAGVFTVNRDGIYHLSSQVSMKIASNIPMAVRINIVVKRGGQLFSIADDDKDLDPSFNGFGGNYKTVSVNTDYLLFNGDQVWIEVLHYNEDGVSGTIGINNVQETGIYFAGHLVSKIN